MIKSLGRGGRAGGRAGGREAGERSEPPPTQPDPPPTQPNPTHPSTTPPHPPLTSPFVHDRPRPTHSHATSPRYPDHQSNEYPWYLEAPQNLTFACPGKNETYSCEGLNYTWTDGSRQMIPPPYSFMYSCPEDIPDCKYWDETLVCDDEYILRDPATAEYKYKRHL